MRFCATMRRPAFSITALMAPVRLRAVASGLMIENVRSTAIGVPLREIWVSGLIESMPACGKAQALSYRAAGLAGLNLGGDSTGPLWFPVFGRPQRVAYGAPTRQAERRVATL